ncbi:MAG: hypothetical protein ACRDC7_19505, partial [Aeromonas veronii]
MQQSKTAKGVSRALRSTDFMHGVEHFWLESTDRPIEVMAASVVGVVGISEDADPDAFPLNTPVLVNSDKLLPKAGSGFLADALEDIYRQAGALCVVVRVSSIVEEGEGNPVVGGVDDDGNYTGLSALLAAESITGVRPTLLMLATGTDTDFVTEYPAMEAVANKLHAIPVVSISKGGHQGAMSQAEGLDGAYLTFGEVYLGKGGNGAD